MIAVPADQIAGELGNPRLVNTILLGVLSNNLPFDDQLWIDTIRAKVKKQMIDINVTAFKRGRAITLEQVKA